MSARETALSGSFLAGSVIAAEPGNTLHMESVTLNLRASYRVCMTIEVSPAVCTGPGVVSDVLGRLEGRLSPGRCPRAQDNGQHHLRATPAVRSAPG